MTMTSSYLRATEYTTIKSPHATSRISEDAIKIKAHEPVSIISANKKSKFWQRRHKKDLRAHKETTSRT